MNLERVLSAKIVGPEIAYDFKDTILYALATGFGSEPTDPGHLRYLYEADLVASPSFGNVLGNSDEWRGDSSYEIDWRRVLHAEQRLTLYAPIPPEGRIVTRYEVMGIRDRAQGAFLHLRKILQDAATGRDLCSSIISMLARGDRGCGDHGDAPPDLEKLPEGEPDRVVEIDTLPISAMVFRLTGDLNPLHIDPKMAQQVGFSAPILHGLCTKGLASYGILKAYCDLQPERLKSMAVRFSRPVIPGDRIRLSLWQPEPGLVRFRATVPSRGQTVLDRGTAEIAPEIAAQIA